MFPGLFVLAVLPTAADAPPLRVGAAKADITPVVGLGEPDVWLAGYTPGSRATGTASNLSACGLTLFDGRRRVAIVALDLIGFFRDETDRIRAAYARAHADKPIDYLILCSTHTHAGPDTIGIWGPLTATGVNPEYHAKVRARVVEVLTAAVAAERPARLRIGRTEIPELIGDSRLPEVIDQSFWVIAAEADDGKAIATLTNWGIHPEVLDRSRREVSADFPGVLRAEIEKARGGVAVHVSGSIGGLTGPRIPDKDDLGRPFDKVRNRNVEQYGRMTARKALAALDKAEPLAGRLSFARAEVIVPLTNHLYLAAFTLGKIRRESVLLPDKAGVPKADNDGRPGPARPAGLAPDRPAVLSEVGLLRIGPAAVAIIPGEIYPELVIGGIQTPQDPGADFPGAPHEPLIFDQIKDARYKLVFGLANDMIGYIIPKSQWDSVPPYCYGRKTAQYGESNSCGYEAAPAICEAFRRLTAGAK